jgi:hypothetical protein
VKSQEGRQALTELVSEMERLDVLMRSAYGRTPDEFLTDAVRMGFDQGYQQGIKAGRRLARGKSEFPRPRPGKSRGDDAGAFGHMLLQSSGLVSDKERIDALMCSVYGCTLDEHLTEGYRRAYERGYDRGIKAGKRLAKGKSEFLSTNPLKSRGNPGELGHKLLRQQFIDFIESLMRESGISLPAAVSRYCDLMGRAWKVLERPPELRQEQLLRLYVRATKLKRQNK